MPKDSARLQREANQFYGERNLGSAIEAQQGTPLGYQ